MPTNYPPGDPRADIMNRINAGSLLVNYVGHGEYYAWGRWNGNQEFMFQNSDVQRLNNANKLPVVIVGNCLNGFFAGPKDNASLAEVLAAPRERRRSRHMGAHRAGYTSGHQILLDALYKAIFVEDQLALGAATTAAKIATYATKQLLGRADRNLCAFRRSSDTAWHASELPIRAERHALKRRTGVMLDQALRSSSVSPWTPTPSPGGPDISGISSRLPGMRISRWSIGRIRAFERSLPDQGERKGSGRARPGTALRRTRGDSRRRLILLQMEASR